MGAEGWPNIGKALGLTSSATKKSKQNREQKKTQIKQGARAEQGGNKCQRPRPKFYEKTIKNSLRMSISPSPCYEEEKHWFEVGTLYES